MQELNYYSNAMRQILISRLYNIITLLSTKQVNNGYNTLANPIPNSFLQSGLYFFLDPTIPRNNGDGNKIIRVGITGDNNNNRLDRHKRGSISDSVFRNHVGRALATLNNGIINEDQISQYIQNLHYLFVPIEDINLLHNLEKSLIEILSNCNQADNFDTPGIDWLGFQNGPSINNAISCSHLWNVHFVKNYNANNRLYYSQAIDDLNNIVNALP